MTQRFSLTIRLTLFYTLVSASVLLGLGGLTFLAINQHFEDLDRGILLDKIHLIQEVGANARTEEYLQDRLNELIHNHKGLFMNILFKGRPMFVTDGLVLPTNSAGDTNIDLNSQGLIEWKVYGHQYRALRAEGNTPYLKDGPLTIWVALDTKLHDHFQKHFQATLTVYVVIATLLSGLLGWFAADRGLAPLRIMRNKAQAVTSNKLESRMPVDHVPVEMAELAKTLNEMLDRLERDFCRLSEFSSDLAHELRTPISNLLTETQVILSSQRSVEEYKDVLASNSEELQRLARMVSDMLFLAKTEHGLSLPSREVIFVEREVQALFDFYDALASEKNIQLVLIGVGTVSGDRLMLRRAISNLLSNALRHANPQSIVTVNVEQNSQTIVISVINRGLMISEELLSRLFDRFFRVDKARSHPNNDGTGLGLAITRAIMVAHQGDVSVVSQNGETRFSLIFPS